MKHHLILFDFDETYYKHATTKEDIPDLRKLEETLEQAVKNDNVITAFLSGSIFPNIMKKMEKAEMKFKPQYIFSDLCSQMYQLDDSGEYHEYKDYEEAVSETPFTKEKVDEIIHNFEKSMMSHFILNESIERKKRYMNFIFIHRAAKMKILKC